MAFGVLERSDADIAVGITSIAGPSGGAKKKPIGTRCGLLLQERMMVLWNVEKSFF